MSKRTNLILGAMGVALVVSPLAAMDLQYGGQVTVSLPAGPLTGQDWLDGQVGGGLGVHMVIPFSGGHAIVPRFDYGYFKKSEAGIDRKVQTFQVGADYNYFFSRVVDDGPYVGGGAGFASAKFELSGEGASVSDTPNTAYAAASLGWMFSRNLGAELRYTWCKFKPDVTGFSPMDYTSMPEVQAPILSASFIFRF